MNQPALDDAVTSSHDALSFGPASPAIRPPLVRTNLEPPASRVRSASSPERLVPDDADRRGRIHAAARAVVQNRSATDPHTKAQLEDLARSVLQELQLPEDFLGFTMVAIGNAQREPEFRSVPLHRRLFLLPERLSHEPSCRADQTVSDSHRAERPCLACQITHWRTRAEHAGYRVMSAADPQVLQSALLGEHVEGVLGIASLSMLERALDFVLVTQIPFHAVPCGQSERGRVVLDDDRLNEVLSGVESGQASGPGAYLPLMRGVSRLFGEDFPRLVPRLRSRFDLDGLTPLGFTEAKAYDWLVRGGKRFRPFITLAAYQSICPRRLAENDTLRSGSAAAVLEIPDSVARVAIAIEAFHKASLAHDDIQDDDLFRYGRETLHRSYGQGPAINIGDYLIGLGYQLVNSCRDELGSDVSADILQAMVEAHLRLCDGQGAEMAWQNDPDWSFTPDDALQIYELKTSPAFEAALFAGLRMAGPVDHRAQLIRAFTRHVGVAFQILNDLHDWQGDDFNKLLAGQDALALRPTVLLAWALEAADEAQRSELQAIYAAAHHRQSSHFSRTPGPRTPHEAVCHREVAAVSPQGLSEFTESKSRLTSTAAARVRSDRAGEDDRLLERLRHVFLELGVFERAEITVETARLEAEALAAAADPLPLRQLLQFLIETVLVRDARSEMARLRTNSSKRQSLATPTR